MTPAKAQRLTDGLPAQLQKVYDVIPIGEAWSSSQICMELARQNYAYTRESAVKCVRLLIERGLIKALGIDSYQRIAVREKTIQLKSVPNMPKEHDAVALMLAHAQSLREQADEAEAAAELMREALANTGKDHAQLAALKALLKELS